MIIFPLYLLAVLLTITSNCCALNIQVSLEILEENLSLFQYSHSAVPPETSDPVIHFQGCKQQTGLVGSGCLVRMFMWPKWFV